MLTAKPLTAREKVQLDNWNERLDGSSRRLYTTTGVLGFVGGAGLAWWLTAGALNAGGSSTLTQSLPFLRPVETALGPLWTSVVFAGVLFAGGMLLVAWRIIRSMRAMREQLRIRYRTAGAVGEVPR